MRMHAGNSAPSIVTSALAQDRLGAGGVAQFALTAAAPLLVVAGLVTTGWAVTGVTGIPAGFIALAVIFAIFAVGYLAMARRIVTAGALYTYVAAGLGRPAGVATATVTLLAYSALQVGLYGAIGPVTAELMTTHYGWNLDWWAYSLIAWALVAALGVLRVDLNNRVLAVLLAAEVILVVVVTVTGLANPAGGHLSLSTLAPSNLITAGSAVAVAIAVTGFIGFEQAPVYAEESRNPRRTVPIATYSALALMTVLYAGASWAMSVTAGPDAIVDQARQHPTDLMFSLAAPHLGDNIGTIGAVLFISSMFAGLIAYHNAVARYAFALGREHVLPRVFGRTALRTSAPITASLVQSGTGLAVILVYALAGWDPMVKLFFWGGTTGALGILLALTATSAAVIAYFAKVGGAETVWQKVIAPGIATIALAVVVWWTLSNYSTLLGVEPGTFWAWLLPSAYAVAAAIGVVWALVLANTRRDVYERIGKGVNASADELPADPGVSVGGVRV
jgi:amino acid transporter